MSRAGTDGGASTRLPARRAAGRRTRWRVASRAAAGIVLAGTLVLGSHETIGGGLGDAERAPAEPARLTRVGESSEATEPARAHRGVAYGPAPHHLVDIAVPARPAAVRSPVLLFLHSGGWVGGSREEVPEWLRQEAADLGAVLVSADYALAADGPSWPRPAQDVDRVIRWLKRTADALSIDPASVVLVGVSAGGHLAAIAAADPGRFGDPSLPPGLAEVDPRPAGAVVLAGISDLTTFHRAGPYAAELTTALMGCPGGEVRRCDHDSLVLASPVAIVTPKAAPLYLIYGDHDSLVSPTAQGQALHDAWRTWANAVDVRLVLVPGDHHLYRWELPRADLRMWLSSLRGGA